MSERLIGTAAVCATLGCGKTTVYRMIKDGVLHPTRLREGGDLRFLESEVDSVMDNRVAEGKKRQTVTTRSEPTPWERRKAS